MSPRRLILLSLAAVLAVAWLWFLAAGQARGEVKRTAFRATLLACAAALVAAGRAFGVFAQAGTGGRFVVVSLALLLAVSYLYLVRFCPSCGRMHRNFKLAACARCGSPLPDHGLTSRPRRLAGAATQLRRRRKIG